MEFELERPPSLEHLLSVVVNREDVEALVTKPVSNSRLLVGESIHCNGGVVVGSIVLTGGVVLFWVFFFLSNCFYYIYIHPLSVRQYI